MLPGHERRRPPLAPAPLFFWLMLFVIYLLLSGLTGAGA